MAHNQRHPSLAARPREAHVLARHDVDGLFARVQRDVGHPGHRQRERRQYQVMKALGQRDGRRRRPDGYGEADGKPPELDGEHHQQHDRQPKRRRRRQNVAIQAHGPVEQAPLPNPRRDAEYEPEHARHEPCGDKQQRRPGEAIGDHLGHGRVEAQAVTEVPPNRIRGPLPVALPQRLAHAPALIELLALLGAHRQQRSLSGICLDGVDG